MLIIFAIALALELYLSFNLTLWLLSRFTQSRFSAVLIVVADLGLAFFLPPLISGFILSSLAFAAIFGFGTIPDFSMFDNPSWMTIALASIGILVTAALGAPVVFSMFAKLFPVWTVGLFMLSSVIVYSYNNSFGRYHSRFEI